MLGSLKTIGILGGGQLGRMLCQAASRLGMRTVVVDPSPTAAARNIADQALITRLEDPEAVVPLAGICDAVTVEREAVPVDVLYTLRARGCRVMPAPEVLAVLQNKALQKHWLDRHGFAQPAWVLCPSSVDADTLAHFGYPLVQKSCTAGYDGRGVAVLRGPQDAARLLAGPSTLERYIDIRAELAVMVARGDDGEAVAYPVAAMQFDTARNVMDALVVPAPIPESVAAEARRLALAIVQALDGVGIFGVELFWTADDRLLVNEVAPRPHNSGHYTMDACVTDQFEQHLRAVTGLPLGEVDMRGAAATVNLLGAEGVRGATQVDIHRDVWRIPDTHLHLYGKVVCWPGRKMGHVTAVAADVDTALARARAVRDAVTIRGRQSYVA